VCKTELSIDLRLGWSRVRWASPISDYSLNIIARRFRRIRSAEMSRATGLTDAGIVHFSTVCGHLEVLDLSFCSPSITRFGIRELLAR
jgi:hypothetical protein